MSGVCKAIARLNGQGKAPRWAGLLVLLRLFLAPSIRVPRPATPQLFSNCSRFSVWRRPSSAALNQKTGLRSLEPSAVVTSW